MIWNKLIVFFRYIVMRIFMINCGIFLIQRKKYEIMFGLIQVGLKKSFLLMFVILNIIVMVLIIVKNNEEQIMEFLIGLYISFGFMLLMFLKKSQFIRKFKKFSLKVIKNRKSLKENRFWVRIQYGIRLVRVDSFS